MKKALAAFALLTCSRFTPAGIYERFAVEGAEVRACPN